jgi:hypothetical protein
MPQSTAALRQKAEALRALRSPQQPAKAATAAAPGAMTRPVRARNPLSCAHGTCLALELRASALWVLVRDSAGQEAWAPIGRILNFGQRRDWAREGFG